MPKDNEIELFGDRDVLFSSIREYFSSSAIELYDVPDFAQVSRNLVSMANYLPLLTPLIEAKSPKELCEIGAYRGISTRALCDLAARLGATLHVVDPVSDYKQMLSRSDVVQHHKMLSEEFLSRPNDVGVYFIDGDHNYEVVSRELELITAEKESDTCPLLFMHDVGWPWGYRDLYYDKSRVKQVGQLSESNSVVLGHSAEFEITLPVEQDFASSEGGQKNGVRKAIHDFLVHNPNWEMISLPSLFGLGVVFNRKSERREVVQQLERLTESFALFNPFLGTLELNRILLISELNKHGEIWKKDQLYIAEANAKIAAILEQLKIAHTDNVTAAKQLALAKQELFSTRQELSDVTQQLSDTNKHLSDAKEQNVLANDQIATANSYIAALSNRVTHLETGKGALRQAVKRIIVRIKQVF